MSRIVSTALIVLALAVPAFGQSQAINGTIEGTIVDAQGGVLPGVTVTVTNIDSGDKRSVITNESGLYRAPLLPLGTSMQCTAVMRPGIVNRATSRTTKA